MPAPFPSVVVTAVLLGNPTRLLPAADAGHHLHPNETGHRMIAEAVDLALFTTSPRN